jgi:Zn-dependent metalloprotease/uncharacterized protein YjdB
MNHSRTGAWRKSFLFFVIALFSAANVIGQQADKTIFSIERNKYDNSPTTITFTQATGWHDDQAQEIFKKYLGVDGIDNTMVPVYSTTTKSGVTAKRYNQYYKGVMVEYASYSMTSKNSFVDFITGNFYNIDKPISTSPAIPEADAFSRALTFVGADKYMWQDPKEEQRIKNFYHKADTSFLPHGVLKLIEDFHSGTNDRKLHLAWSFNIYAKFPLSRQVVFIDAVTGKVLHTNSLIKNTAASGLSAYSAVVPFQTSNLGTTYELFDSTRGNGVHTLSMNNGTDYTLATEYTSATNTWPTGPGEDIALDAHWGAEVVYDYWKTVQGRLSYDNADGILLQYVHYDVGFNNAFWDGTEMSYGDGTGCGSGFDPLTSLDVTGHEIGHGVCQYTAGLVYASESGALNEAFSDCWGATIEAWGDPHEVDAIAKSTWAIGEEITCGSPMRRMDFPKIKNQPDTYGGVNWFNVLGCTPGGGNDQCGVHKNSGVMNKWYYLVVAGGSGTNDNSNTYNVTGIGFSEAANILYQTELVLSSTADYSLMRATSISTATTLYGMCSPEVITVTNAWYAVGVGAAYVQYPANITGTTNICIGATVTLSDATPLGTWSSGALAIATVDASGNVTGLAAGVAPITYSVGAGCDAITTVTVNAFPSATITPAPTTFFCAGNTALLTATTGAGLTYQWKLGGGNIPGATNQVYTAGVAGNYTVVVGNAAGCRNTSAVTAVSSVALPSATITPSSSTTFCAGSNVLLNAPSGAGYIYQWQLSGSPIPGATDITYAAGVAGPYSLVVTNASGCFATSAPTTIVVNPLPMPITGPTTLCVTLTTTLNDASVPGTWTSSNPAIASVGTGTGIVTGVGAGSANITFTVGTGCFVSTPVLVNPLPLPITGTADVCLGLATALSETIPGGSWTSSNTGIATIGSGSGTVSGLAVGTATMTYTLGVGCFAVADVTVNPLPAAITGTSVVCVGATTSLSDVSPGGVWSSGNPAVATVGSAGDVTGVSGGTANITYTIPTGCIATNTVTVNSVSAASISGPSGVCFGQSVSLSDPVLGGVWSSSNPSVAIVNPSGSVIGASVGSAIISYAVTNPCGTDVAVALMTVNPLPVVAPVTGSLSVCSGHTSSLADATPSGAWSSSNTSIATISSSGIVSAILLGTTNINYTVTSSSGCIAAATAVFNVTSPVTITVTAAGPTSFCTGASVLLNSSTGAGYTYQWKKNGAIISGATTVAYTASTTGNYAMLATLPGGCNATSAPVAVNVNPASVVVPAVNISASAGPVFCSGVSPVTFTASAVNGGSSPVFQWYLNSVATVSGITYSLPSPATGDVITCVLTSDAACAYPVTASRSDTISIGTPHTPSLSIAQSRTDICMGDTVTFSAVPVYGGTAPTYLWTLNSVFVGTAPAFRYAPANGDRLTCTMASNYPCVVTTAATASYRVTVQPVIPNSITISTHQLHIAPGVEDTFVAVAPFAGSAPAYQWRINGVPIPGATGSVFITSTLTNGQVVSCEVTSSNPCVFPRTELSIGDTISVWATGVRSVNNHNSIELLPNPNNGAFTLKGKLNGASEEKVNIIVSDVLGQKVYQSDASVLNGILNEKIMLDNVLANGMYTVTVTTGAGSVVFRMILDK